MQIHLSHLFLLHRGNTKMLCKYSTLRLVCVVLHPNSKGISVQVHTHSLLPRALPCSNTQGKQTKSNVLLPVVIEGGKCVQMEVKPMCRNISLSTAKTDYSFIHSKNSGEKCEVKTFYVLCLFRNISWCYLPLR